MLRVVLLAAGAAAVDIESMFKGLETERSKQPFHFKQQGETVTVPHDYYGDVQKSTFRSPAINLMNGEAWFTLPTVNRMPFPHPGKPYAIVRMDPDIIDSTGRRPPTSELYGHHWLMYDKLGFGSGDNLGCGGAGTFVSNIFGAGAEMRGVDYHYPNGYGYFSTEGQEQFSANLHFINTIDLSTQHFASDPNPMGSAIKSCIECNYSPGNTGIACLPGMKGNFACCVDEGRCHVNNKQNTTKTTYYLTYDIYWTLDLTMVKPLRYGVIDTWTCGNYGNLKPNLNKGGHKCDDKMCVSEVERTIDLDGTIVWMYGHQHVGAINGSVHHNGKEVCTSTPHYGTDPSNPIGNEKGYITKWDICIHADGKGGAKDKTVIKVKKGDKLRAISRYNVEKVDPRILPMPGGDHSGVMGLFYFTLNPDGGYVCKKNQCVATAKNDGVDLPTCQTQCNIKPGPPATLPPLPPPPTPPTPSSLYKCQNGNCAPSAGGVAIDICKAACG